MTEVARFSVSFTRLLDETGRLCDKHPPAIVDDADLLTALYRSMVLARAFDGKAIALQRTGRLGTYASTLGQEAIAAAIGLAMQQDDVLAPFYRDFGAQLARGVSLVELLAYWGGDERGMDFAGPREDLPICVPIATQTTQAVGVAYAFKLRRQPRVVVCTLGDGATSKGDFYEAINLAGVWQLPVVFVIVNNQWAISVPRKQQTAAQTLAQKAIAAGIPGEQVDGNDAIAMYHRLQERLAAARSGGGSALIEAMTYRLGDHTTADDASRYRPKEDVERHRAAEPIARLRKYLEHCGFWSDSQEQEVQAEMAARLNQAAEAYLARTPQPPEAMFDYLYAELPAALREQRDEVARRGSHD